MKTILIVIVLLLGRQTPTATPEISTSTPIPEISTSTPTSTLTSTPGKSVFTPFPTPVPSETQAPSLTPTQVQTWTATPGDNPGNAPTITPTGIVNIPPTEREGFVLPTELPKTGSGNPEKDLRFFLGYGTILILIFMLSRFLRSVINGPRKNDGGL